MILMPLKYSMSRLPFFLFTTLILLLILPMLIGCGDSNKNDQLELNDKYIINSSVESALQNDKGTELDAWREFLNHWPLARQQIAFAWHQDVGKFRGRVDATALIEERYVFKIIIDMETSKKGEVITFSNPKFNFCEVKDVRPPPQGASQGGYSIRFNTEANKWFGSTEWKQLEESHWNFSTLGITIRSNAPVPNIMSVFPNL